MPHPSLRLHGASFSFAVDRPLLQGADLHLVPGWTGLVGPNGAGKSTLLRLLSGELAPGLARRTPASLRILRLEQGLEEPEPAIAELADAWDADALRLRSRLQLGDLDRWPTLSPGERRRWQLAAALWAAPDVLLLDEPDNHLDAPARDLLIDALRQFTGIGLLVSHDRALLDAVTSRTVRLERGRLESVDAPYSAAQAAWDAEARGQWAAFEDASRQRRAAERRLQASREVHTASDGARSFRHVGTHDHDARSDARKFRAQTAEEAHGARLARANRRAERALAAVAELERPPDLGRAVTVAADRPPRSRLIGWSTRTVMVGGQALLRDVSLTVEHGDRVWLRGPNGAGKSTLLRALFDDAALPTERVLHLPQELAPDAVTGVVRQLHALPPERRGRVLQIVAALGLEPDALLATDRPSPGEARKLALALGLAGPVWLVALDEPDNHLDLASRLRLEAALGGYGGALLLITHDAALARATTRAAWTVGQGGVRVEAP